MKYGQQRLAAGRKNFIFFLCPLDGEQFILPPAAVFCGQVRWEGISLEGDLEAWERCAAGTGPGGHGNSGWQRKLLFDR